MTGKELLEHPSVRHKLSLFRSLGGVALVRDNTITLFRRFIPFETAEAFATFIRRVDTEGLLAVTVSNERDGAVVLLLHRFGVPLETWGTGDAKTLEHLLAELATGECELVEQGGRLVRKAEGAIVHVYCQGPTGRLKLVEQRQVFRDGREKIRNPDWSIGEKMKPGEHPRAAAHRALAEELGIQAPLLLTPLGFNRKGPGPSISFPGLLTIYDRHAFEVTLPPELVRPEGYVEHQDDKSTYFVWIPADGA